MIRIRSLLLLTMLTTTAGAWGCGFSTGPSVEDGLLGTWAWVESTGGIAGVTLTPASTGESMTLRFTAGGEARLLRNGSLERTVGFDTSPGPGGGALEVHYDEPLMGFEVQTATFPSDRDLVLTDPCCDGFTYRYVRTP